MKKYEAMFLLDGNAAAEWSVGEAEVRRLLERAQANILGLKRWDERKLCYEINHRKRGVYALAYFEAPPDRLAELERDVQISEVVLRMLLLRDDELTPEKIEKALAAPPPPKAPERTPDAWAAKPGPRERGGRREREGIEDVEVPEGIDVLEEVAELDVAR